VKFEGRKDPVITIPRNDNDQRTAAAWLDEKQIPGRPDNWDGAQAPRQVDFNGGYSGSGHKYAVRLTLIPGMLEPDPYPGMPPAADTTYGQTVGDTPKTNQRCRATRQEDY